MIVALSVWNQRIAPVFDVGRSALICAIREDRVTWEYGSELPARHQANKIHALLNHGTEVLICGAISRDLLQLAEMYSIRTFPFTAGEIKAIKEAFLQDRLLESSFAMPGCHRHRKKHCRAHRGFYS